MKTNNVIPKIQCCIFLPKFLKYNKCDIPINDYDKQ